MTADEFRAFALATRVILSEATETLLRPAIASAWRSVAEAPARRDRR